MTERTRSIIARPNIFHGWYVVGATMIVMTVASGLGFYNLSVYLKAFVAHGGFSVASASAATACFFVASGVAGIGVGALIEKFDLRWMLTCDWRSYVCSSDLVVLQPGTIFAIFCGMMVLQLVWVKTMVPETKGVSLEQMQKKLGIR